jgi:hypothetical protein
MTFFGLRKKEKKKYLMQKILFSLLACPTFLFYATQKAKRLDEHIKYRDRTCKIVFVVLEVHMLTVSLF